ncbi:MAG: sigma-70 family RNA polymerase sigma factor [Planctomycetaceae bacterium]
MPGSTTISAIDLSTIICDGSVVDHDAFQSLYEDHNSQLLRFLGSRVRGRIATEDVAADVWLKVLRKADQFDGMNFRAWMFTIARSTLIDTVRRLQRDHSTTTADQVDVEVVDQTAESLQRQEELAALHDCIQSVGGPFVEAVVRTKLQETAPEQLAQELNISRATVDSRVSRGRKLLSDCIESKQKTTLQ